MHINYLHRDKQPPQAWNKTMSSRFVSMASELNTESIRFVGFKSCFLQNNDKCEVGDWVLLRLVTSSQFLLVGKVLEILQIFRLRAELCRQPDFILLSIHYVTGMASVYLMPQLAQSNVNALVNYKVCAILSLSARMNKLIKK